MPEWSDMAVQADELLQKDARAKLLRDSSLMTPVVSRHVLQARQAMQALNPQLFDNTESVALFVESCEQRKREGEGVNPLYDEYISVLENIRCVGLIPA